MIKVFRKIRFKLMETGKTGKYFKYAIGEIILVVIGILIALQVNNWNEKRKLDNYEKQLLIQLKNDLERNSGDLKFNIRMQENLIESSDVIVNHINKKLPYSDTLKVHFANTAVWTKFIVNAGAYKTIESKGLDLISDLELRDLIFRIYEGNLNWLRQMEQTAIDQIEDFRINKASNYFSVWYPIQITDGKYVSGTAQVTDYESILNDNAYKYYINAIKNHTEVLHHISKGYLDDNLQGIEQINAVLNLESND
ncbi:DUF6090 family protein [Hanstruepera ponticola]|uniref:DUF6090 family protein n=1 Tax=Hanstruepera ponticola TaxID=2042995 RepID=UPI000CF0AA9B|nr:DUF6090 family protein [Hanstruepera ponticola]